MKSKAEIEEQLKADQKCFMELVKHNIHDPVLDEKLKTLIWVLEI